MTCVYYTHWLRPNILIMSPYFLGFFPSPPFKIFFLIQLFSVWPKNWVLLLNFSKKTRPWLTKCPHSRRGSTEGNHFFEGAFQLMPFFPPFLDVKGSPLNQSSPLQSLPNPPHCRWPASKFLTIPHRWASPLLTLCSPASMFIQRLVGN